MKTRATVLGVLLSAVAFAPAARADVPHVVAAGETLTSVAATDGLTVAALAAANGLAPSAKLIAGEVIQIPPRSQAGITATAPVPTSTSSARSASVASSATTSTGAGESDGDADDPAGRAVGGTVSSVARGGVTSTGPTPTGERVSAAQIGAIAAQYGVPPSLAEAIAWQESGWNNALVSPAGAVGVMQIVPGTWTWIDRYLTPGNPLSVSSAADNIRAGVLLLRSLLSATGGDQRLAVAAYFQGLASVRAVGMYPDTRIYVADVLALEQRLGG